MRLIYSLPAERKLTIIDEREIFSPLSAGADANKHKTKTKKSFVSQLNG